MRLLVAFAFFVINVTPVVAFDWPTFGHDASRSGYDAGDRALTKDNVGRLRERWQTTLGTAADSSPILVSSVHVGSTTLAMLFQTATDGTTYGIDASDGRIVWRFATHGPKITQSSPVADPSAGSVFVPGVDGFVHKLDPATGTERTGDGFPARITRMSETEKDASALNLANGYLYATTSGYFGDAPPYVGHVVTVRLSDGMTRVFNSLCSSGTALPRPDSCSQSGSGIWARAGAVVDPDPSTNGRVYVATGNGDFDAAGGGANYGDSVLALSRNGARLEGSYTPVDYAALESGDTDLGSTAPALLPREARSRTPLMAVQGGKDSILRLLDRDHLGGVGGELQHVDIPSRLFSAPAVWSDPSAKTWIYLGLPNNLQAYRLETDAHGTSRLVGGWSSDLSASGGQGTSPVVCNGIVFVATSGAIEAFDAETGRRLWNSARPSAGGTIGGIHWQSPIVVNGWLFCSDQDGHLTAYALPR